MPTSDQAAPRRFRKKPVVIEAIQLVAPLRADDFAGFMGSHAFDFDGEAVYIPTLGREDRQ